MQPGYTSHLVFQLTGGTRAFASGPRTIGRNIEQSMCCPSLTMLLMKFRREGA